MEKKVCAGCLQAKGAVGYFNSPNPIYTDGLPLCKTCCSTRLEVYTACTGNETAGFWCLLAELSIPFIQDIWVQAQAKVYGEGSKPRRGALLEHYLKIITKEKGKVKGFWESDVMLSDLMQMTLTKLPAQIEAEAEEERALNVLAEVRRWGRFRNKDNELNLDAYRYLNSVFESYTKDILEMDTNLENRYKDLCVAEWRLREANEKGDIGEIKSAQEILNKQLALLKLNDFESNTKSDAELAFDKKVAMIEYSKPAECEDLQKYLDMVGYEKQKALAMRSLRNAVVGMREYPEITKENEA